MSGQRVCPTSQIFHVVRQEAQHQFLYLPFVPVIVGFQFHLQTGEIVGLVSAGLTHRLDIPIQHRQELQRVQFLAFEADGDMQFVTAQSHRLPGLDTLAELGKHIGKVSVGHFILPIADSLADAVSAIIAHARHDAAGKG